MELSWDSRSESRASLNDFVSSSLGSLYEAEGSAADAVYHAAASFANPVCQHGTLLRSVREAAERRADLTARVEPIDRDVELSEGGLSQEARGKALTRYQVAGVRAPHTSVFDSLLQESYGTDEMSTPIVKPLVKVGLFGGAAIQAYQGDVGVAAMLGSGAALVGFDQARKGYRLGKKLSENREAISVLERRLDAYTTAT